MGLGERAGATSEGALSGLAKAVSAHHSGGSGRGERERERESARGRVRELRRRGGERQGGGGRREESSKGSAAEQTKSPNNPQPFSQHPPKLSQHLKKLSLHPEKLSQHPKKKCLNTRKKLSQHPKIVSTRPAGVLRTAWGCSQHPGRVLKAAARGDRERGRDALSLSVRGERKGEDEREERLSPSISVSLSALWRIRVYTAGVLRTAPGCSQHPGGAC